MPKVRAFDGTSLYVEESGRGTPVVFVHEYAGDYRSWEPQVRHFSRQHRCVTYSQRGYPPSDVPSEPGRYSQDIARDDVAILLITDAGYGKRTQLHHFNKQGRGGLGVIGIRLTAKKGSVVAAFMVGLDDEVVLISSGGVVIRTSVREISSQGRDATGVRVMNLDAGQTVASVAPIAAEREEEEAPAG